jgi:hypothetical protein
MPLLHSLLLEVAVAGGRFGQTQSCDRTRLARDPQIEIILMSPSPQNEGSDKLAGVAARRNNAKRLEG